jgi:hypothetical protein
MRGEAWKRVSKRLDVSLEGEKKAQGSYGLTTV